MPSFSKRSLNKLSTCRQELQDIFREVIKIYDCSILEGHRGQELQDKYFRENKSKIKWPNGKHNSIPSEAVDVAPYPIDWEDIDRFFFLGGLVKGIASQMGYKIRWGRNWDGDNDFKDQTFNDYPHFEIRR